MKFKFWQTNKSDNDLEFKSASFSTDKVLIEIDQHTNKMYGIVDESDSKIWYRDGIIKRQVNKIPLADIQPIVFNLPARQFVENKILRFLLRNKKLKLLAYFKLKKNAYIHSPFKTEFNSEHSQKLNHIIRYTADMEKANIHKQLAKGTQDKKTLIEYIPYVLIGLIVFMFLMGYQVMPYI